VSRVQADLSTFHAVTAIFLSGTRSPTTVSVVILSNAGGLVMEVSVFDDSVEHLRRVGYCGFNGRRSGPRTCMWTHRSRLWVWLPHGYVRERGGGTHKSKRIESYVNK